MPQVLPIRRGQLVAPRLLTKASAEAESDAPREREPSGFGARPPAAKGTGKGRKRRGTGLAAADRSPLGKSPDLDALRARQQLGLALAGRLSPADVTRAWKRAAAEHHPDRGGQHGTMQTINVARDALLGRGVS
ncbi:molecular chaperone DnaJ [Synechococcus sp. Tobar12-5m-g]|uniref:molecular chaperone DnaJ n=1 Tax=unclassified Synechococcus TaxID=2626047 RepID=UPI0020CFCCD9|nr:MULTISPECIES: molecular chaperone DnaJ [unclassified Synechococcus]MCP9772644.1 molecular chaperone DnaJ [Synechococcus sp. Tobar12-5m-g]MCP9873500.1 molecular chaperone DnaJ [Synechococcus sp. Cruz CV-v-12]